MGSESPFLTKSVLTTLLRIGPRGPPAKVPSSSVYRPTIALLLGKRIDAAATPNLKAPQAPFLPSLRLARRAAEELRGRLADGRLGSPAVLTPVT